MNIGIPQALFYYYNTEIVVNFFKNLGFNVILSDKTTKKLLKWEKCMVLMKCVFLLKTI